MAGKVIKVECRCGYLLFDYYKGGHGRLIKCFIDKIVTDHVGISGFQTNDRPICPQCNKCLGIIKMINGRPALKLNQGTIRKNRT